MYSPNANKDLKTLDRKIDINNIFTQNRLSLDDSVEGGRSLLGGEYILKGKDSGKDIIKAGLATVLKDDEEINLPTKSTLNNKGSDFIGSMTEPIIILNLIIIFQLITTLSPLTIIYLKQIFL